MLNCLDSWKSLVLYVCFAMSCRTNVSRDKGGLGHVKIPLLSDVTHNIAKDYGVFGESSGYAAR